MPKHTLYFSDLMYQKIGVDRSGPEGLSGRVSTLCSIAIEGMDECMPALPLSEWQALLDISNGLMRTSEHGLTHMVESFRFGVAESGPECNEKWGIKCADLARKLACMTLLEQCAVMEVTRRFWTQPDVNAKYDDYEDILLAHGAKLENAK